MESRAIKMAAIEPRGEGWEVIRTFLKERAFLQRDVAVVPEVLQRTVLLLYTVMTTHGIWLRTCPCGSDTPTV